VEVSRDGVSECLNRKLSNKLVIVDESEASVEIMRETVKGAAKNK
jgi:hypothetical protein